MSFIWNKDVNEIWYAQAMYIVVHIYNLSMLDDDAGSPAWAIETQFFKKRCLLDLNMFCPLWSVCQRLIAVC